MSTIIAITQRQDFNDANNECRDALDNAWFSLLAEANLVPLILPNHKSLSLSLVEKYQPSGYLLSGGNDLVDYGGKCEERDHLELALLEYAITNQSPLLGVCRGMQVIQNYFGLALERVNNHVQPNQDIEIEGGIEQVNSYHKWGTTKSLKCFETFAQAHDGVVKGIKHEHLPLMGIMWHPERCKPFRKKDVELLIRFFSV